MSIPGSDMSSRYDPSRAGPAFVAPDSQGVRGHRLSIPGSDVGTYDPRSSMAGSEGLGVRAHQIAMTSPGSDVRSLRGHQLSVASPGSDVRGEDV